MSCNGCRVLRKGCNDNCILRQSLQGIDSPQAQAHATVFVAKFFGRAGLMSFLSAVPDSKRPALFQSLLFEACGRTVNPVNGAVGLLWTGNWQVCQSAVETVLRGGVLRSMPELFGGPISPPNDDASETDYKDVNLYRSQDLNCSPQMIMMNKRKGFDEVTRLQPEDNLDLGLMPGLPERRNNRREEKRRARTPSEESETTTFESGTEYHRPSLPWNCDETKILRLFL